MHSRWLLDFMEYAMVFPFMMILYHIAMFGEKRCSKCGYRIRGKKCTLCGADNS